MQHARYLLGFLFAAVSASSFAQTSVAMGGALTGRVETVFVRESRNLFIEKKLIRKPEQKELWAEVRLESPTTPEYPTELARLPDNLLVEKGDLVATLLADSSSGLAQFSMPGPYAVAAGLAPLPDVSRVTALLAKRDTLRAMLFGLNNPQPGRGGLYMEAQACTATTPTVVASYYGRDFQTTITK